MNFNIVRKSIIMLINGLYIFCVSLFFLNYDIIWDNRCIVNNQLILVCLWLIATALIIMVNVMSMKFSKSKLQNLLTYKFFIMSICKYVYIIFSLLFYVNYLLFDNLIHLPFLLSPGLALILSIFSIGGTWVLVMIVLEELGFFKKLEEFL